MILKLKKCGFSGKKIKLIESYLGNRRQAIEYNSKITKFAPIKQGLPQESVLSPLLFSIFMDDIFKVNIAGITILFADEITIIFSHKKFDKLHEIINRDLKNIFDWFAFNKLVANLSKFYYLLIGCNSNKKLLLQFNIKETDSVKILDVTFDKRLSFQQHTQRLSNTLLRKIGVIYRIRNQKTSKDISFNLQDIQSIEPYLFVSSLETYLRISSKEIGNSSEQSFKDDYLNSL